ncbi:hypothetical protein [Paenibacillus sp. FSL R5-0490]|uniref:hypothetical protein n=1 Tax=Bacillales TaxID=1385 RepID=UPI00096D2AA2|nr:hypothetical protein [Paenibacillus sp. FSL R5-0490]
MMNTQLTFTMKVPMEKALLKVGQKSKSEVNTKEVESDEAITYTSTNESSSDYIDHDSKSEMSSIDKESIYDDGYDDGY